MKGWIIFILFISQALTAMEKPPAFQKTEQAPKEPTTYFEMLPSEIIEMVSHYTSGQTSFEQLDNAIAMMRTIFSLKEGLNKKFLNDYEFNEALIKMLAARFHLSELEVALMLHTHPSLNWVGNNYTGHWPHPRLLSAVAILRAMYDYLKTIRGSPQEKFDTAIAYVKRFLTKPYLMNAQIFSEEILDDFIDYIVRMKGLNPNLQLTEAAKQKINIALAFGTQKASEWLSEFIKSRFRLSYLLRIDDIIIQILEEILVKIFKEKDKNKIHFLLNSLPVEQSNVGVLAPRSELQTLTDVYKRLFKLPLINSVIDYVFQFKDWDIIQKLINLGVMRFYILERAVKNQYASESDIEDLLHLFPQNFFKRFDLQYGLERLIDLIETSYVTPSLVETFIKMGVDVNAADDEGKTPLMYAVQRGRLDLVQYLLSIPGININACDKEGHNALWYAQQLGINKFEMIALLQEHGAEEGGQRCVIQ